jgi:hypothetical protein
MEVIDEQIKYMVDRFLGWRLPENFNPDAGISFKKTFNENTPWPMKHEPVGTNLFDAGQAEEMIRYMFNGIPDRREQMKCLTFRNSEIVYYGPHECSNCGVLVAKMAIEFGGNAFTYPEGPIYPNTEWHSHVCDPQRVAEKPKACDVQSQQPSPIALPLS